MPKISMQTIRSAATPLLCAALATAFALTGSAAHAGSDDTFRSAARSAILIDVGTGAVLFAKNPDEPLPPASMSKMMTLYLAFRAITEGKVSLDTEMPMSVHAWRTGGAPSGTAAMFVPVNTKEKLSQLLRGVAVQSGNDAAIAIAEGLAGSEAAFASQMNAEAERLGLSASHFANPTGLDNPGQRMSARDLATLARHIIEDYPELYKVFGEREFRYRRHRFFNRNPLLRENIGVDGLKTGFTNQAGYGMAASAKRDGRRLIAVVMGLRTAKLRASEARKLLNWGFATIDDATLFDGDEVVGYARLWGGQSFYVPLIGKSDIVATLPKSSLKSRLRAEISYDGPLKPPVRSGDEVAVLTVYAASGSVQTFPLYAANDVKSAGVVRKGLDAAGFFVWRKVSAWFASQTQSLAASATPGQAPYE